MNIDTKEGSRRYRILSLDGGGVKGAYSASVLHTLETLSGKSMSDHFDLITGTSTGGIIAIAIGLGVPLCEIVDLYVEQGPIIFPAPAKGFMGKLKNFCGRLFHPKHSQDVLSKQLLRVFEDRPFGASRNRLVVPAFNAINGEIHLFKTAHCPAYRMDHLLPATTVALATSAAPTYFSAFTDPEGRVFLDGGVWANCPAMVGVVEAMTALGWPIDQIDILSVGTTCEPFDIDKRRRIGGLLHWNTGVIDLLQEAQVRGTLGLASRITSHRLMRIDATVRPGRFSLDCATEVSDLRALGENSARQKLDEVSSRFLTATADPFVPCHIDAKISKVGDH